MTSYAQEQANKGGLVQQEFARLREHIEQLEGALPARDRIWCEAAVSVLDIEDIQKLTAEFNRRRPARAALKAGGE
jgi:hypothetical protein